ncbi:hypothetical protein Hanom_Chr09g00770661 [Helianthus anomalus]
MSYLSNNVILRKRLVTNVLPKAVKSRKPVKFDVECTPRKRMASQLKTTEDKGKVIFDRKETVKNTKKGFHATLRIDTPDDIACSRSADKVKGKKSGNVHKNGKHTNKITKSATKHSADLLDAEFFQFVRKGDYMLV